MYKKKLIGAKFSCILSCNIVGLQNNLSRGTFQCCRLRQVTKRLNKAARFVACTAIEFIYDWHFLRLEGTRDHRFGAQLRHFFRLFIRVGTKQTSSFSSLCSAIRAFGH